MNRTIEGIYSEIKMTRELIETVTDSERKRNLGIKYIRPLREKLRKELGEDNGSCSLRDGYMHYVFPYNGEDMESTVREGWIEADKGRTDEEIESYVENCIYRRIYGPYDCTGKRFTNWVHWNRTPVGIVFVHQTSLDV